ncbi:zinc finger protein 830 [Syngnathoides biaculeatus]|uniref:zinc finger protein 830 n=1 Tax=Syngnathoides biaculeatus TaxID=300417 RepID=UPI002ADD8599|nr:zinc finger protein 830 [Syngnathoides biaculeatus]
MRHNSYGSWRKLTRAAVRLLLNFPLTRMATAKKGKKVVNQEQLRRLMREKQRQTSEKKRVESPFAKYNSLGHLSCVLCNAQVKSELLWPAHVLGKLHKEKVSELKEAKHTPQSQPGKRKATDDEQDVNGKKAKQTPDAGQSTSGAVPEDFPEKSNSVKKSAGVSLLAGVYDDDDEQNEEAENVGAGTTAAPPQPSGLPADFFDSSIPSTPAVSHSGSIAKAEAPPEKSSEKKDNTAEVLPEGFFDDPVRDAKVRNVDAPKDHMDKEWEEFQKEIRQVNTKSEAIVAEDDEEGRLERQIDEIDEQIECYKRVEMLRDKRDAAKRRSQTRREEPKETEVNAEEKEEENEEELLGLLSQDWRAKGALA